jgi:DNA-binding transcriptional LysR family regulator
MQQATMVHAQHAASAYLPSMAEMTLLGLRVVLEVARQGSFSAAAAALGYTQSAVSRQVASMESAAGTALFERRARGVRTTAAGELVVRRAARVLGEVDGVQLELAGLRDRLAGRLVVAAYPVAAAVLVPRAIARLLNRHPALDVELLEASSPVQLQRLRAGRLEVGLVATGEGLPDHDLSGLRTEPIRTGRGLGVAVCENHRLAARAVVDAVDLRTETWVVGTGGEGEPQFLAWPTLDDPHIGYRARGWPTRFGLVAAGLAISLVPGVAADAVPRGVRWLPVRDPAPALDRTTYAVTAAEPSGAATAMVDALRAEAAAWAVRDTNAETR